MSQNKMLAVVVEPMKAPVIKEIGTELEDLQALVGGYIEVVYPYSDYVGLLCNSDGKIEGLELNRALYNNEGEVYDIIAGTFAIIGLSEEDFASLTPELAQKYAALFKAPESFIVTDDTIIIITESR